MHEGAACVAWVVETSVPPHNLHVGPRPRSPSFLPPLSFPHTPARLSCSRSPQAVTSSAPRRGRRQTPARGWGEGRGGGRRGGGWGEAEDPAGSPHVVKGGDGGPCRQHSEGPRPLGNDAFEVLNSSHTSHSSHTPHTCFMLGGSATSASTRQVSESVRSGEDEPRPEEDDVDGAPVSESEAPAISSSCAQYRGADTLSGRGR